MHRYVAITIFILVVEREVVSPPPPPPLRVTIDCGSEEDTSSENTSFKSDSSIFDNGFDVHSFCRLIHNSIPKAVKDGKFIVTPDTDYDQSPFGDTLVPVVVAPPQGFPIPRLDWARLKFPRQRIPKISVPRLLPAAKAPKNPPRIRNVMTIPSYRDAPVEEESSAERMERFKKGVQKMLHFVKVLGQVDQYLSERMRIIIDKLSKTFAE